MRATRMTERASRNRTQSGTSVRAQMDTMATCPAAGCEGGEVRRTTETDDGRYSVCVEQCSFCQGAGVVPVWRAAEHAAVREWT